MTASRVFVAIGAVLLLFVIVTSQTAYVIEEGEQAIVTRFGEPKRVVREPGLYVKTPFIESLTRFDKRVLSRDTVPQEYLTLDRKRVVVDHVTRWRIEDPLQFYRTVRTEPGAVARLDDVAGARLRQELAKYAFIPIVREVRDDIMDAVSEGVEVAMEGFGIAVLDVRIKRLDLPTGVQESVFERMRAERSRIASGFRGEGEERAREIRADADRQAEVLIATAFAESQRLRGEGDAQAIKITGEAFGRDQEFYGFLRRLEVYGQILGKGTTLVLPSNSDLLRYLEGPNP